MITKVLKVQTSGRPIWKTKLSINGPISDLTSHDEQSYEMRVDIYLDENTLIPEKTIMVDEKHYENNISKYGMAALLKGIELTSLLDVAEGYTSDESGRYYREVELIAYSIVAKVEQEMFFNPDKLRSYIESKLLSLKDKFNIEPK